MRKKVNFTYCVHYILYQWETYDKYVIVTARNKEEARIKAIYEEIPKKEKQLPYEAIVTSVTYQNGKYRTF